MQRLKNLMKLHTIRIIANLRGGFGLVSVVSDSVVGEAAEGEGGVPQ